VIILQIKNWYFHILHEKVAKFAHICPADRGYSM